MNEPKAGSAKKSDKNTQIMRQRGVHHMEAYCIMIYQCKSCHYIRLVWNSRDGVSPFGIVCTNCDTDNMLHTAWGADLYSPKHVPEKGDIVFCNLTLERWKVHCKEWIDQYWNHGEYPLSDHYKTKDDAYQLKVKEHEWWQPAVITYNGEDLEKINTPPEKITHDHDPRHFIQGEKED